ncbi:S9 family peptidase [Echinicola sp. 20G]|uniref:alpha/beta hydrolase family protein n=1 Tax=Echinicola sp. 20G TaxID=2781961 RepID=UPI0019110FB1|nr:prolyl oligopeptidase family serine peptidase [Echinicola sp. 20G]
MNKRFSLFLLCVLMCMHAFAQEEKETPSKERKPISWEEISNWEALVTGSGQVSPDGKWFSYTLKEVEGDGKLILEATDDTKNKKTYPIGDTSRPRMDFSENSRWLAFIEYPNFKDKKDKSKAKKLFNKLILLDLKEDKKVVFEKVQSFTFNNDASSILAINLRKEGGSGKGSDLLIYHLENDTKQNIGNVLEFSFNKSGKYLSYTVDAANQSGNGIYLFDVDNNRTHVLESDEASFKSIHWTEEGDGFAALKMTKDKKYKQELGAVIGVKNLSSPEVIVYNPKEDSISFPDKYTISPNQRPSWSDDLSQLFYGIHDLELAKKPEEKKPEVNKDSLKALETEKIASLRADTTIKSMADLKKALSKIERANATPKKQPNNADKPNMTIWHWKDDQLQSRQEKLESSEKRKSLYAVYNTENKKHTTLQDSTLSDFMVLPKQHFAIASDAKPYELQSNLTGKSYRDFYIIDIESGEKTLWKEKFYIPSGASTPKASPDGTKFLFAVDGDFFVYDLITKEEINLTADMETTFVNTDDDHNVTKPMNYPIGWDSESKYVLLKTEWDIWQVPVNKKKKALNLTVNGESTQTRYQGRFGIYPDEKGIDLSKKQYFRAYGEWTKKSGVISLEGSKSGLKPGPKVLVWEDAMIGQFTKAKAADAFIYSKETYNTPPAYFLTNASFENPEKITDDPKKLEEYTWSSGVKLVDYVSDKGVKLQGALFLPADYEEGKKYPTMVYYYEKLSSGLHNWTSPDFGRTGWNPNVYTSNGYAVFMPDITYTLDDPGMSAVWCVIPAVKAAIETGIIDEENIGIHGHSWGGYQTAFLVTQTDMFKAAAAGAALTNMISMYDLIYWNSGNGNMAIFESSQGRFTGGPWENWESYERNSPIYHVKDVNTPLLMLHNDKDGAVDFTQGLEYYNALRRLQKPVVMVQYKGENHGIAKLENRKDYSVRMMEFFDHHLKGKPAPEWLESGVKAIDLDDHLKERAF